MKKNKVTYLKGTGAFTGAGKLNVTAEDGSVTELGFKNAVIATGSEAVSYTHLDVYKRQGQKSRPFF